MDQRDLDDARAMLEAARQDALDQFAAHTRSFDEFVEGAELVNTDDEHDPEGATIAFERAQVIALRDDARRRIDQLDEAIRRIDAGTYGTCVGCGEPINPERLHALPGVNVCVSCAAQGRGAD